MRSTVKVALGIDVTDAHVHMVLLKKDRGHLTVVNTARVAVPEGAVVDGHIEDTAALAKVIKAARRSCRMGKNHVAVSLPPTATLARIVPLEEDDPQRITQFVAGEVQQYAALSGRKTVSDFRVLVPSRPDRMGKILIVASDRQAVSAVMQTCRGARCRVGVVEPAVMACTRALRYAAESNGGGDNSMLVLLKSGTLTVCAFQAGILSFIRTKFHDMADAEPESVYAWVAEEVSAELRFCGIERGREPEGWSVTVVDEDRESVSEEVEQTFRASVGSEVARIVTQAPLPEGTVIGPRSKEPVSATAFGLAVRLLETSGRSPSVNLMPPEGTGKKSVQRAVLVGSIAVSFFTLLVLLAIGALEYRVKQVNQNIVAMKQADLKRNERTLGTAATELAYVERRIGSLTGEYEYLKHVAQTDRQVNWAQFLVDLKAAVPKELQVVNLSTQDKHEMLIQGVSRSYESVDIFVQMLNRSASIGKATVLQKSGDETLNGLVQYAVQCTLNPVETP